MVDLDSEILSDDNNEAIQQFQCSDEISVETFLKENAMKLQICSSAVTRLYFDGSRNLIGYFTLHNDLMTLSNRQRRRHDLQHMHDVKNLPAIKLHYLGVDDRYRKKGYGEYLLFEALDTAVTISQMSGCNFMTLESLESSASFYHKFDFKKLYRDGRLLNMFYNLAALS